MITASDIYWITRLDGIKELIDVFSSASFISFCICVFFFLILASAEVKKGLVLDEKDLAEEEKIKGMKFSGIALISFFCLWIFFLSANKFIPTTKEMAVIKIVPAIANSDFVQEKLPKEASELYDFTKQYLKTKILSVQEDKK